jgi:hypothetical protein
MDALLFVVILLFLILCIGFKEGYYSDTYTNAAVTSMTTIVGKLNTLQSNLKQVTLQDLTLDAQSKLNPLLHPPDETKYSSGIVEEVHKLSNRIARYQDDLLQLTDAIHGANDIPVRFKDGDVPLSDAIDRLLKEAKDITTQLNQIPDS